jgi:DNA-directed RNA polymerase subunit E'
MVARLSFRAVRQANDGGISMYYMKTLEDRIRVPPSLFGSQIEDAVQAILRDRYEGRIYKDLGIVLSVNNPKVI